MSQGVSEEKMEIEVEVEAAKGLQQPSGKISLTTQDIAGNVLYIIKGVELNQPRLLQRAIKQNVTVRRNIQSKELYELLDRYFPVDHELVSSLKDFVAKLPVGTSEVVGESNLDQKSDFWDTDAMEVEVSAVTNSAPGTPGGNAPSLSLPIASPVVFSILPEVEIYLFTLIVTTLLRLDMNQEAADASVALIERIRIYNRRSLDIFSSKAYFYYSLAHERVNSLAAIRPMLLALYRTACVRHDEMGQAVLLNVLLRNYLHYNLIDQAYTLSMRSTFPESASNNQFCRFLYYMGRIQAIQLDYSESYQRLMTAARKAPQGYANNFSRMVYKLVILVQLLMGDIPERSIFNQPELRLALKPYLAVTQAVRNGDLRQFNEVVAQYSDAFKSDKNYTLVQRLGHNVLKIGLRKISVSYSRVSLQDVADKLHLPSAAAAEYICSKAILDGVIEAKIDHENGWLSSHEVLDLYSTEEPQKAFHKRIAFCLDVHNEAVKSMRYPPDHAYKKDSKKQDDKDEEKTIEELIKEMEDDFDE